MSPWRTWRHIQEARRRGEEVVTQAELLVVLKDFARLVLYGWLVTLTVVGIVILLLSHVASERDSERDASFNLICTALQANSKDVAGFAGAVVRLVPPEPPPPPRARAIRDTAQRVYESQSAFAGARCQSRDDLQRLVSVPPPPAKPEENP